MKSSYEERAKKFMTQFFPYIKNCHMMMDYYNAVDKFNRTKSRKVSFHAGVSRGCFVTSDYVIKFDLHKNTRDNIGNCESEMAMYAQAVADGFEYLFAKITHFEYAGRDWYIMPRINGINEHSWKFADECIKSSRELNYLTTHVDDMHSGNYGWKNRHIVLIDYACNFTVWDEG